MPVTKRRRTNEDTTGHRVDEASQFAHRSLGFGSRQVLICRSLRREQPVKQKFIRAVDILLARLILTSSPSWTGRAWDQALQDHLEHLHDRGPSQIDAASILAAVLWLEPGLGSAVREACPWSAAALQGWTRLEPGLAQAPFSCPVALAIVLTLANWQLLQEALVL